MAKPELTCAEIIATPGAFPESVLARIREIADRHPEIEVEIAGGLADEINSQGHRVGKSIVVGRDAGASRRNNDNHRIWKVRKMVRNHETIHDAGERIGMLLERLLPAESAEREEAIAFVRAAATELETLDKKFGTNTVWTWPFPERS